MKKLLIPAFFVTPLITSPVQADFANEIKNQIANDQAKVEAAMDTVSDNLTAVFAHRGLAPADTLGGGIFGFEVGIDATFTDLNQTAISDIAGEDSEFDMGTVPLPKLSAAVGFPLIPLEIGATYLPEIEGFSYFSAHAKYALIEGGIAMPAISLTGSYSKASMEDAIDVETKGVDLSISKGFGVGIKVVPYAGVGYVSGTTTLSDEVVDGTNIKREYDSSDTKLFAGASFQMTLLNIVVEIDKIGDYQSQSLKFGLRF